MTAMREIMLNGKWPLVLPEHRAARSEWLHGWETASLDSMFANLRPGMTLVDVGSEEADMAGLFASWGCDVVLMEPNPRVWPNAAAIFRANELEDRVKGWWVGLASDVDDFGSSLNPSGGTKGWPECANGPVISDHGFMSLADGRGTCAQITLDTFVKHLDVWPDAITMDVEGGEVFVARGAQALLSSDRPPLVWVSVHPEIMMHAHNVYANEFFTEFHKNGYVKTLLDWDHELHVLFHRPDIHTDVVLPCSRHGYDHD